MPDVLAAPEDAQRLSLLFDRIPVGISIVDRDFVFRRLNPTLVDFISRYSRTPREAIVPGANFFELVPDVAPVLRPVLVSVLAGATFRQDGLPLVADGITSYWDVAFMPLVEDGQVIGILSVVSAATERVQAITDLERRIDERTRELTALLDTTTRMASTLELRPLVGMILDQLRGVADYAGAAVLVIEGDDLVTLDARWEGEQDTTLLMQCFPGSRNDRPWAEALPREPVIIPDLREDTVFSRWYWQAVGEVMNRPPYDQFRAWLGVPLLLKSVPIGILVMAATKPNFYTPEHARLALAFANQAAIAVENARLYEQAQKLAALEERARLARELHDSVTQTIFSLSLIGEALPRLIDRDRDRARERLARLNDLARGALAEMRALIFDLRPESLESEGLVAALERQAAALRDRHQITVEADLCAEPPLPLDLKRELYGIAREALHNTVKHARAARVHLRLATETGAILLEVRDDGVGFDPSLAYAGHLGLHSMRERVERVRGTIDIASSPGAGARIHVRAPL